MLYTVLKLVIGGGHGQCPGEKHTARPVFVPSMRTSSNDYIRTNSRYEYGGKSYMILLLDILAFV